MVAQTGTSCAASDRARCLLTASQRPPLEGGNDADGDRTYELMKSWWPIQQAKQANPEVAKYMNETPKVVAAHEAFKPDWNNTIVVSGDVAGEVRKLKERSGKRIVILGSNTLCVSLMQHGLVDEFQIMMNPIALGNGTPLFKGLRQRAELRLSKTRDFKSGNVLLTYTSAGAQVRERSPGANIHAST